jgi:hypothetical protein
MLAGMLLERDGLPYCPTDALVSMLQHAAPALGLRHGEHDKRPAATGTCTSTWACIATRRPLSRLTACCGTAGQMATDMAEATGVPLALGLSQICSGLATCPGVHPPDAIIDRDVFFAQLAAHTRMDLADCLLVEQQGE